MITMVIAVPLLALGLVLLLKPHVILRHFADVGAKMHRRTEEHDQYRSVQQELSRLDPTSAHYSTIRRILRLIRWSSVIPLLMGAIAIYLELAT